MNILKDISSGAIEGTLKGVGELAKDIRVALTGEIDAEKKAEIELKLLEFENGLLKAQAEVNKAEATHRSIFVAGWRPAIGWICALSIAYEFIIRPFWLWIAAYYELPVPIHINTDSLFSLVLGMLGLAGFRTFEKLKGVSK